MLNNCANEVVSSENMHFLLFHAEALISLQIQLSFFERQHIKYSVSLSLFFSLLFNIISIRSGHHREGWNRAEAAQHLLQSHGCQNMLCFAVFSGVKSCWSHIQSRRPEDGLGFPRLNKFIPTRPHFITSFQYLVLFQRTTDHHHTVIQLLKEYQRWGSWEEIDCFRTFYTFYFIYL